MKFNRFEEIIAWQKGRELNTVINKLTDKKRFNYDINLINQMRSASGSITSNIAEGYERDGRFIQFLSIAKGSSGDVRSQLYLAFDLEYISKEEFEKANGLSLEISRALLGLINYLKNSELKGLKYLSSSEETS